jgi:hypothetical protein
VSLSSLGSFRSVRRECGAIEFDEVDDPLNLNVCPLELAVPKEVEHTDRAEELNAHHNLDGGQSFLPTAASPILVNPFDARI